MRRYAILVPARLGSTRLPEKVLAPVGERFLLQMTLERAADAPGGPQVLALVDDERVAAAVEGVGFVAVRTSPAHVSGTDRCAEAARGLGVEAVVNLQADEPLVDPQDLADLARAVLDGGADLATLAHPFADPARAAEPSAVKALVDEAGWAVGFQRALPTPDEARRRGAAQVLHHLGVYAFRLPRLLEFAALPPSPGEQRERLEQLRALDAGWRIRVLPARTQAFGIDTPADLERLRRHVSRAARRTSTGGPDGGRAPAPEEDA